jgi:inner membrane protein
MPTIITHAVVPLCLGLGLGSRIIPPRLLLAGVAIAMLPDADVLAFKLGVAYGHVFGHRGFTHSLLFAFALPTLAMLFHRQLKASAATVWSFLLVSLLSHSLLDSLTTGGKGVGFGIVVGCIEAEQKNKNLDTHLFYSGDVTFS